MMGSSKKNWQERGFLTPPPKWKSNHRVPVMPRSERNPWSSVTDHQSKNDLFHVVHKVPAGHSPYVKAKHVQVIDKDPSRAVSLFWSAINAGDRVDSALKDMAIVLKQLDRSDEAIEAIKSFRDRCSIESQESLDNILMELYKKSGRIEEEIQMLQVNIKKIEEGSAFDGKRVKMARSQGKKIHVTIEKEHSRLLGNLAWAFLQLEDYKSAEEAYRKALTLELDKNKQCNLAICLIHLNKIAEAKFLLQSIRASCLNEQMDESYGKSFERATQLLDDLELQTNLRPMEREEGVHKEVHIQASGLRRSSKGFSSGVNAVQDGVPGSKIFLQSQYVHHDEMEKPHEWLGRACLQNCNDNSTDFQGNVGRYCGRRRYDNRFSNGQIEGDSHIKADVFPGSVAGTPRVPFTQPRRCLWPFNEDHRTSQLAEAVGGTKLTFEQNRRRDSLQFVMVEYNHSSEFKSAETSQIEGDSHIMAYVSPGSVGGTPRVPFTQPRKCLWQFNGDHRTTSRLAEEAVGGTKLTFEQNRSRDSLQFVMAEHNHDTELKSAETKVLTCESWRKHMPEEHAKLSSELLMKSIPNGGCKSNFEETDELEKFANSQYDLPSELLVGSVKTSQKQLSNADCEQSSNAVTEDAMDSREAAKRDNQNKNSVQQSNSNDTSTIKKSWADMVEEEEQLLQTATDDFPDENCNTNIALQTPNPLKQSRQKPEFLGFKDGYYTQPINDTAPINQAKCFASPLQKRALNFECDNAVSFKEEDCATSKSLQLIRRNRLQVFRDITPQSPRW